MAQLATWFKAFAVASIFLSRLPMPNLEKITAADQGRSLLCFPLVGLMIGLALALLGASFHPILSPLLLAALLTTSWVAITGGLHLDGLADSADGWLAGAGNVQRTLEIMRDPRCGSGAVVAVSCLLMVKFAAISVIVEHQLWLLLVIAPVVARSLGPLMLIPGSFPYTPYLPQRGTASDLIAHAPAMARSVSFIMLALCALLLGSVFNAAIVTASCALTLWLLRRLMLRFLGGSTGDTLGASIEIVETVLLISAGAVLS